MYPETTKVRREEMRDGIRHVKSVIEAELRHLRKSGAPVDESDEDIDGDACRFGTMPPVPRRKLVAGASLSQRSIFQFVLTAWCGQIHPPIWVSYTANREQE